VVPTSVLSHLATGGCLVLLRVVLGVVFFFMWCVLETLADLSKSYAVWLYLSTSIFSQSEDSF
jgi:hypothetical protein